MLSISLMCAINAALSRRALQQGNRSSRTDGSRWLIRSKCKVSLCASFEKRGIPQVIFKIKKEKKRKEETRQGTRNCCINGRCSWCTWCTSARARRSACCVRHCPKVGAGIGCFFNGNSAALNRFGGKNKSI